MKPKRIVFTGQSRTNLVQLDLLCPRCLCKPLIAAVSSSKSIAHCVNCQITLS